MLNSKFFNEGYGAQYETTNIGDLLEIGKVYEVYVSEVYSPYKFWFQLGEDDPNPLDELQESLKLVKQSVGVLYSLCILHFNYSFDQNLTDCTL